MTYQPKKILVATDFSVGADVALAAAADLAKLTGARITLLHVIPWSVLVDTADAASDGGTYSSDVVAQEQERAHKDLEKQAALVRPTGVSVETRVEVGPIPFAVSKIAQDEGFDLVATGTHGRTGLAHIVLGSVAEGIVRNSRCPVLTFPTPRSSLHQGSAK